MVFLGKTEMRMIRWMCVVFRWENDSTELRRRLGVDTNYWECDEKVQTEVAWIGRGHGRRLCKNGYRVLPTNQVVGGCDGSLWHAHQEQTTIYRHASAKS